MELSLSTRFPVRRYLWYIESSSDHAAADAKYSSSLFRACAQVIPALIWEEPGCLTQNHPFSRGSFSLRIREIQFCSSPAGMRSGFVRTPIVKMI